MSFGTPELRRYDNFLDGIVSQGRVTQVDTTNRIAATVTYPDRGYQTGFLNVLQRNTISNQDYTVPEVGEMVWVLHPPRARVRGLILGSVYTVHNPPPYNVGSTRGMVFKDGTFMIYDYKNNTYQINIKGKWTIVTTDAISMSGGTTISITAKGNITVTSQSQINLNGVIIDANGNVKIPGNLEVVQNVQFDAGGTINTHLTNIDGAGGGA